eukprot:TRINITY_DN1115_c0_g1_i2.p1 TRINITY_DN1115_c0_g1~~TRINITY_DN1115_c0_g1_i2.p1  ORF type:complete len:505 (-),score=81.51 TRINITY_DN1115_c0_g1_i2:1102-2616(-)
MEIAIRDRELKALHSHGVDILSFGLGTLPKTLMDERLKRLATYTNQVVFMKFSESVRKMRETYVIDAPEEAAAGSASARPAGGATATQPPAQQARRPVTPPTQDDRTFPPLRGGKGATNQAPAPCPDGQTSAVGMLSSEAGDWQAGAATYYGTGGGTAGSTGGPGAARGATPPATGQPMFGGAGDGQAIMEGVPAGGPCTMCNNPASLLLKDCDHRICSRCKPQHAVCPRCNALVRAAILIDAPPPPPPSVPEAVVAVPPPPHAPIAAAARPLGPAPPTAIPASVPAAPAPVSAVPAGQQALPAVAPHAQFLQDRTNQQVPPQLAFLYGAGLPVAATGGATAVPPGPQPSLSATLIPAGAPPVVTPTLPMYIPLGQLTLPAAAPSAEGFAALSGTPTVPEAVSYGTPVNQPLATVTNVTAPPAASATTQSSWVSAAPYVPFDFQQPPYNAPAAPRPPPAQPAAPLVHARQAGPSRAHPPSAIQARAVPFRAPRPYIPDDVFGGK